VIFSNGKVTDFDSTKQAIVELSYLPVSVILIGVGPETSPEGEGEEWAPDFSKLI